MSSPRDHLQDVPNAHETFKLPVSLMLVWLRRGERLGHWLKERLTASGEVAVSTRQVSPDQQMRDDLRVLRQGHR